MGAVGQLLRVGVPVTVGIRLRGIGGRITVDFGAVIESVAIIVGIPGKNREVSGREGFLPVVKQLIAIGVGTYENVERRFQLTAAFVFTAHPDAENLTGQSRKISRREKFDSVVPTNLEQGIVRVSLADDKLVVHRPGGKL